MHVLKEDGLNRSALVYLLVILIPLSYCFKEKARFVVWALFARGQVSRLIKPDDITKKFWDKAIQFQGTFQGLKIAN